MGKRKRGIVRREKLIIDGKEVEVDTFDAAVVLGSGEELESIEELLIEEEIEKSIQAALKEIEALAQKHPQREKNIWYSYEVGKVLQFVDKKGFTDRKGLIWRRMAYDLRPDLFGGKKTSEKESTRYPETMYYLGKQRKEDIKRANFGQWYEILKFKKIYESKDIKLLEEILAECESKKLHGVQLRQRIKELQHG